MEAIGLDLYNQSVTGKVSKALTAAASDADHVPCVLCTETFHLTTEKDVAQTLKARDYKDPLVVLVGWPE